CIRTPGARGTRRRAFSDSQSDEGGPSQGGGGAGATGRAGPICAVRNGRRRCFSGRIRGSALPGAASEGQGAAARGARTANNEARNPNRRRSYPADESVVGRSSAESCRRRGSQEVSGDRQAHRGALSRV